MTQGSGPVEDGVMAALRFDSGMPVTRCCERTFNVARTPAPGSRSRSAAPAPSLGRDVRADARQARRASVRGCAMATARRVIPLQPHNLYAHSLATFSRAVQGLGAPSAER